MAIQTVKTGAAVNDGTGDDARTAFTRINQNFTYAENAASRQVGTAAGNVMEVGAFGLGNDNAFVAGKPEDVPSEQLIKTQIYRFNGDPTVNYGKGLGWSLDTNETHMILGGITFGMLYHVWIKDYNASSKTKIVSKILTTLNTQVDTSNGYIKGASPIIKLFADSIQLNEEAKLQPITLEKLGVGDYLIKGSLGFAQEGWYIETPKDANGNVLVAVVYEQLANNDISVKTYAKKFDEETGDVVANTAKPRDIPSTRWIDLRLQALPQSDIKPFNNYETAILDA